MKIAVIDGQGAGLGQSIIKKIRKEIKSIPIPTIIALGTNNTAALNMKKAGADLTVCEEKDILGYLQNEALDCIIGPIGIMCSGGIRGEISSAISNAILQLECTKYILPLKVHGIYIPGTRKLEIKDIIDEIVDDIRQNYQCE